MATEAFEEAAADGHRVVAYAELLRGGVLLPYSLIVASGHVDVDATAGVRRRCELTLVDKNGALNATQMSSPASPYGNEIRLSRGISINGTDELLPVGTFRIEETGVSDDGGAIVRLAGFDRSVSVAQARFEAPYAIPAGQNYGSAIQGLLESRVPGLTYLFTPTARTTPLLVFLETDDPWAKATEMARSIGMELFFDVAGRVVLRPEPDPASDGIAAEYMEGEGATYLTSHYRIDTKPGYNGAIVVGEPPGGTPVRGEAWDSDPASATYYLGPYGKRPRFLRSQFVVTQGQADEAAAAIVLRERGGTEQLSFTALPHPGRDAGDSVYYRNADLGLDEIYVIDTLRIPLAASDVMSVTTRKRRSL